MTLKTPLRLFLPLLAVLLISPSDSAHADDHQSVARVWNEALLYAIRNDFARPTVHARNLFHASAAMYDAWAVYHPPASPYFLGRTQANGFDCPFTEAQRASLIADTATEEERLVSVELALSVAMRQLMLHRFDSSPGAGRTRIRINSVLSELEITIDDNPAPDDLILNPGTPQAIGYTLAQCIIDYGLSDGANEVVGYRNQYYQPVNDPVVPLLPGNAALMNPDRWQPVLLNNFIDQSGNPLPAPEFIGAEWGNVLPFALTEQDRTLHRRDGDIFTVYLDPGPPALHSNNAEHYAWGHSLVAAWSAHLDPSDGVVWDISPAALGVSGQLPDTLDELKTFYNYKDGGVEQSGHTENPITEQLYPANSALRGDYTRVIAEYWADGPDSETPPGHWFTMLNDYVLDHPDFERRFMGEGEVVSALEFDVRSYFLLGGAMHDAAVAAWSVKGWYDYIRPVSALRYLAELGQSSDVTLPNFNAEGIPLLEGIIEVVQSGDTLAGVNEENVGKIKVYAWRGPAYISNASEDIAGVGWILLDEWWPYQRATFVTPPFAGYVSGHSTFSRAAAEVLTALTGSEFFPGGVAEFVAEKDEFLVFEQGPSQDVTLQWATFRDASDQSSLSRIWGGIHPPVDDVPGRKLGIQVAERAITRAESYFTGNPSQVSNTRSAGGGCSLFEVAGNRSNDPALILILLCCVTRALYRRLN